MDSVNVSVLPYEPVRSASLEAIDCLNPRLTVVRPTGLLNDSRFVGLAEPPSGANAPSLAFTCSFCGRKNEPLTRWPVFVELGSATERVASPALETTWAVVDAV